MSDQPEEDAPELTEQQQQYIVRTLAYAGAAYCMLDAAFLVKSGEMENDLFAEIIKECVSLAQTASDPKVSFDQLKRHATTQVESLNRLMPLEKSQPMSVEQRRKMN